MYMNHDNYEKFSTKYNKLANFFIYKKYSDKVFEKLLSTNRISLPQDTYATEKIYNGLDHIYIRALYQLNEEKDRGVKLLVSNDARRKITSLYKDRLEEESFERRLRYKIGSKFGLGYRNVSDFTSFMQHLACESCFTAGSFPLQVFLDEDWSGSDLDIFVLKTGEPRYSSLRHCLRSIAVSEMKLSTDKARASNYEFFNEVWEYTLSSGFRIQIIEVINSSMDRILKNFDFDFCKIAWSFNESKHLVISPRTRKAIETRTCEFDLSLRNKHKCAERLEKYEARGFTVTNAKEMLEYEKKRRS